MHVRMQPGEGLLNEQIPTSQCDQVMKCTVNLSEPPIGEGPVSNGEGVHFGVAIFKISQKIFIPANCSLAGGEGLKQHSYVVKLLKLLSVHLARSAVTDQVRFHDEPLGFKP